MMTGIGLSVREAFQKLASLITSRLNYQGEYLLDKKHGWGVERNTENEVVYEGYFERGVRHGSGTLSWSDGSVYRGQFRQGRAEVSFGMSEASVALQRWVREQPTETTRLRRSSLYHSLRSSHLNRERAC